jgi:hypothetical protein
MFFHSRIALNELSIAPNGGHQLPPPEYWQDSIRKAKNWKLMATCALSGQLRAFVGRNIFPR